MELRFHEKGISVWCVSYPQKMAPNAVQRIPNDLNIVRNGVHEVRNDLNIVGNEVREVRNDLNIVGNEVREVRNDLNIVGNGVHEVGNALNIVGNESVQFTVLNQNSYYSQTCLPAGRFVSIRYPYLPLTKKIQPVTK